MKIDSAVLYAQCPCGSGKKFKFCCFEKVRNRLCDWPTQSDVTLEVRKAMQPYGMVNGIDPIEDREAIGLLRDGIELRETGELNEAIDLFRRSREMKPRLYTSWNNEAQCLWFLGKFDEAAKCQEEGLALSSDANSFGWAQLAEMRYFLGDGDEYDRCIGKAMAIPPISNDAAIKVCAALARQRRHGDILEYARKSGFADAPWVAYYMGMAALNTGDVNLARSNLEIAAASDATMGCWTMHEALRDILGLFGVEVFTLDGTREYLDSLDEEKEKEDFREAVDLQTKTRVGTKKWFWARDTFKNIYARHPDFFRAGMNYAGMLEREGLFDIARPIIEKIAEDHPRYGFGAAAALRLAMQDGDMDKARAIAEGYRFPERLHPTEYLCWKRALAVYLNKIGDEKRLLNVIVSIRRVCDVYDL